MKTIKLISGILFTILVNNQSNAQFLNKMKIALDAGNGTIETNGVFNNGGFKS
jgi:hypothetical protein